MRRLATAVLAGLAGLTLPTVPASAAEPIEGRWSMGGGVVELRADAGGFTSHWVEQRPDILCPAIDDQDGDMRLEGGGLAYTGTWNWVLGSRNGSDCKSLGRGPVTITVGADGQTAQLEADAPAGYDDHESHTLTRAPDGGLSVFARLSTDELAGVPELMDPIDLSASLGSAAELAAVPRLQQLPFQGRAPFTK